MEIEFTADEWYDHHRGKVVWFRAMVDDKCIDCGISLEALRNHFGAYYDDPLPAFRSHRARDPGSGGQIGSCSVAFKTTAHYW